MSRGAKLRSGGQVLVDALRIHGVDRVFCVPGESYLAVLDALYDARASVQLVVCRHEGGAAYMAAAHGKITGAPGVCIVTRGPGAGNAVVGVHTARQDSIPMVLLVGQVARNHAGREAFQEIDVRCMYAEVAKWVAQIDDARRIPEFISRAFHHAVNGRPGPVVLALPEDMLADQVDVLDMPPFRRVVPAPRAEEMREFETLLFASKRPLVILGGGGWTREAALAVRDFAAGANLPVAVSFRRQDLFDNTHPNYVGDLGFAAHPGLVRLVEEADLLIAVGARLGEISTVGYELIRAPLPRQKLVHVHLDVEELGRVYRATLPINSGMMEFAAATRTIGAVPHARWRAWTEGGRADYVANLAPARSGVALDLAEVLAWLRERLPEDAIIANGAGNYTGWVHRYYRYRAFGTQLAPTNGSMGYGVPAAIAAKLAAPDRIVVAFAGDGCFLMNGQEIATAVQYRADVIFIVVNNGMYGTIRMHQERAYPGRVIGTDLVNPDFAALAQAYGLNGQVVTATGDFPAAFEAALNCGRSALIELRVDPEALTPRTTLSEIRRGAFSARGAPAVHVDPAASVTNRGGPSNRTELL